MQSLVSLTSCENTIKGQSILSSFNHGGRTAAEASREAAVSRDVAVARDVAVSRKFAVSRKIAFSPEVAVSRKVFFYMRCYCFTSGCCSTGCYGCTLGCCFTEVCCFREGYGLRICHYVPIILLMFTNIVFWWFLVSLNEILRLESSAKKKKK